MKFEDTYRSIMEDMSAGGMDSVFGTGVEPGHGGDIENSDFYATDDSRLPQFLYKSKRLNARSNPKSKKRKSKRTRSVKL